MPRWHGSTPRSTRAPSAALGERDVLQRELDELRQTYAFAAGGSAHCHRSRLDCGRSAGCAAVARSLSDDADGHHRRSTAATTRSPATTAQEEHVHELAATISTAASASWPHSVGQVGDSAAVADGRPAARRRARPKQRASAGRLRRRSDAGTGRRGGSDALADTLERLARARSRLLPARLEAA